MHYVLFFYVTENENKKNLEFFYIMHKIHCSQSLTDAHLTFNQFTTLYRYNKLYVTRFVMRKSLSYRVDKKVYHKYNRLPISCVEVVGKVCGRAFKGLLGEIHRRVSRVGSYQNIFLRFDALDWVKHNTNTKRPLLQIECKNKFNLLNCD